MSSSHTTLSAAADDRRARLAALKSKSLKRKQADDDEDNSNSPRQPATKLAKSPAPDYPADETMTNADDDNTTIDVAKKYLSGRNYDAELRGPKLGFDSAPVKPGQDTVEARAAAAAAEVRETQARDAAADKPLDLFGLQPKKPNWDLRRDLERRMAVLNTRTDNAIAKLVRERVAAAAAAKTAAAAAITGRGGRAEGSSGTKAQKNGGGRRNAGDESSGGEEDGQDESEEVGMEGTALVEAMHVREREEEEDARRERLEDEALEQT